MSPSIWTRCAERFEPQRLSGAAWRAVESQHVTSTRKLVDSDDEQQVLESLIDTAKPPWPLGRRFVGLHYLLATPFRHPPLRYGSRFGTRRERGIFYCSEGQATVFAEKAYYVLLFLEGTEADIVPLTRPLTVFQVRISTKKGADLTRAPFRAYVEAISSPSSYGDSQPLGASMRQAGVAAFRFTSARDPEGGANLGLFEPVFSTKKPVNAEQWICTAIRARVELKPGPAVMRSRTSFSRDVFTVDGVLPVPGVQGLNHR
ncbi:MAG: RES domain-containing protein [Deltaproteobacteria bacterium]|nr:MAG: RES domain-containing protein [Deltaproteobacteria bacterium]